MEIERSHFFTGQELNDKERRNLLVYDLIRRKRKISRAEITKATGINAVSVSNYVNNFIERKMVLEKGFDISTGGRKPELIELNSESGYVIGIDIGKSDIRGVSTDIGLGVKVRKSAARPPDRELPPAVNALVGEIVSASKIGNSDVHAVGLGISEPRAAQITAAVRKNTGIDTYAAPRAVCAAFAEKRINQSVDCENLLYIYSDVGYGVMMHGDAYVCAGDSENISDDKVKYLRPWSECLSLIEGARREVAKGVGTKIVSFAEGEMDNISRRVVVEAAKADDEVALNIVLSVGMNLGLRIAYLINLFSPDAVIMGGGVQDASDIIFMPIKKMIERFSHRNKLQNLKVILSALGEDAVDIGAAALAVREIFIKA